ncbi:MAG: hypothetical protein IJA62_01755 [Ruminococcus sp.]|nr:hypothetical protein [Ruminococcus sp.]
MATSLDLMSIYGIPPARYSEDNPDDLFLKGLPSLEQIASFNLANAQQSSGNMQINQGAQSAQNYAPVPQINNNMSTPTTTLYGGSNTDVSSVLMPSSGIESGSASSELPSVNNNISQLITDYSNPFPVTAESIQYLNGFIRTQIGRRAQIQFLMGNAELIEKDGFLLGVGANYILINEIGTNDITACDFYNIKFIRFLY